MDPNLFPSFFDFSPSDSGFRCIAHTKYSDEKRCLNRVARKTRDEAQQLRTELTGTERRDLTKIEDILKNYAKICCCKNKHQGMVVGSDCIDLLVQRWKIEIIMKYTSMTMKRESFTNFTDQKQYCGIKTEEPLSIEYHPPIKQRQTPATTSSVLQTQSRYNLRSGSPLQSQLSVGESLKPTSMTLHKFIPYQSKLKCDALRAELLKPLSVNSLKTGDLYLYTRSCDPGFVKIGYTTQSVFDRMEQWRKRCQYDPIVKHTIANVPNIYRAERLVHMAISKHRRKETFCKTNVCCTTQHMEWFEIDWKVAVQVMNKVAGFLQNERPYGSDAMLSKTWRNLIMEVDGELTLDGLLSCRRPSPSSPPSTLQRAVSSSSSTSSIDDTITPIIQEPDKDQQDEETTLLCDDDNEEPTLICEEVEDKDQDQDQDPNTTKEDPIDPIDPIKAAKSLISSEINKSSSLSSSTTTTTTTTTTSAVIQNDNTTANNKLVHNITMIAETKALMIQLMNLLKQAESALAADRAMLEKKDVWDVGGSDDNPVIGLVRSETIDLTVAA